MLRSLLCQQVTWFDLTNSASLNMQTLSPFCCAIAQPLCSAAVKGSTMDAMSDAIEGAEVLLYGVSLKYKESASEAATTSRHGCHL